MRLMSSAPVRYHGRETLALWMAFRFDQYLLIGAKTAPPILARLISGQGAGLEPGRIEQATPASIRIGANARCINDADRAPLGRNNSTVTSSMLKFPSAREAMASSNVRVNTPGSFNSI